MYVVLEHAFRQRGGDEMRNYLGVPCYIYAILHPNHQPISELSPAVAPIKCCVLPLSSDRRFDPIIEAVRTNLISRGMSQKTVIIPYLHSLLAHRLIEFRTRVAARLGDDMRETMRSAFHSASRLTSNLWRSLGL